MKTSYRNNKTRQAEPPKGPKPTHRLWMVIDPEQEGKRAEWKEIIGLWPTSQGEGFSGAVKAGFFIPPGARVVVQRVKEEGA